MDAMLFDSRVGAQNFLNDNNELIEDGWKTCKIHTSVDSGSQLFIGFGIRKVVQEAEKVEGADCGT